MRQAMRGWKLLLLLCLANIIAYIGVFELPPLIGNLVHDFHITYAQAGLFMSVYALVRMIGSLVAGSFSDQYGVKYFVICGLLVVSVAGFLCAHSHSFTSMLVFRVMIGIGATLIFIPGLAASMYLLKPEQVNLATGTFFTSMNLGLTAALLVTPIVAASSTWRTPFNIFAGCGLLVTLVFVASTWGQSLQPERTSLLIGRNEGFAAVGEYSIRNVPLLFICAGYFLMLFQAYGMITWLPEYLKVVRNYSPAQVGTVSMLLGLVMIPGTFIAGFIGDRIGAWPVGIAGTALCALTPAALIFFPGLPIAGVFGDVFLLAVGICFLVVPLTSILSYLVPAKDNGKAVGLVHTTGYAGSILSTYLGGYLLTLTGSYRIPFLIFALAMVVMLFIFLSLRSHYSAARQWSASAAAVAAQMDAPNVSGA
jgi:predicted MFS family arabinose efflux permease